MARYDLLLKGGTVVDPGAGVHDRLDVAIAGDRVAAVERDLPVAEAARVIDVAGLLVTAGLIDFHLHAYWGGTDMGLDVDRYCLPRGVTTVVDCGSAGAHNFLAFRRLIIDQACARVRAFLHLSTIGQVDVSVGELANLGYIDVEATARCLQENRDVILGLKLRLGRDAVATHSLRPLAIARELADRLAVPIMVHIGDTDATLPEVLAMLRRGDVVTHTFTPRGNGVLDERGQVLPAVWQAVERGVKLDSAMGRRNLAFRVARVALAQGLALDTISSDVTIYSVRGSVRDLPHVVSGFLALGLGLDDALACVTAKPARQLGLEGEIGTLWPGACADVAAFALAEGEFTFVDATGETAQGRRRLEPRLVLRAGKEVPVQEIGQ